MTGKSSDARAGTLTLAAMSLGFGVVQLDVTIVNVAINSIGESLGGGIAALQWVINAYTIAFAALILTAGALGDRIGAKRVFMAGFAIFTIASVSCAAAPSLGILIISRVVQGLGAAMLVPNSLALLNHAYKDGKERSWAVAIWAAGASAALTAGPLAGGVLISIAGWRSIFLVNVPIGLLGLWLAWRYASETPASPSKKLDIAGQVAGIIALASVSAAIIEGGKEGWTTWFVVTGFIVFVVAGVAFIAIERTSRQPMLPLSLFANRTFSVAAGVGLLVNAAFYGLIFIFSLYFQQTRKLSVFWSGLAFAPMLGSVLIANLIAPRVSNMIGAKWTIAIGIASIGLGCAGLLAIGDDTPYALIIPPFIAMGAGLGFVVPPLTSMLLGSVDKARSGIASGVLNSMRQIGSVFGVALFGSLVADTGGVVSGAHWSLGISAALLFAALLATMAASQAER